MLAPLTCNRGRGFETSALGPGGVYIPLSTINLGRSCHEEAPNLQNLFINAKNAICRSHLICFESIVWFQQHVSRNRLKQRYTFQGDIFRSMLYGLVQIKQVHVPTTCPQTSYLQGKKRRLEELKESATMNKLLDLVGRGQISVTSASEIAGCVAPFSWFQDVFF